MIPRAPGTLAQEAVDRPVTFVCQALGIALVSLLFTSANASAKPVKQPAETFVIEWKIVPEPAKLGEVIVVKSRTSIGRAHLRPSAALALAESIFAEGEGQLVDRSELLARAATDRGSMIGCTFRVSNARASAFIAFGSEKYICLIDSDKNGDFDRAFKIGSAFAGVLAGRLDVPGKTQAIKPVKFVPHDTKSVDGGPYLYVQYAFGAGLTGTLIFQACLMKNAIDPRACLTSSYHVEGKALPASFQAFGAQFTVRSKDKAGVSVAMEKDFVEQPLTLLIQDPW